MRGGQSQFGVAPTPKRRQSQIDWRGPMTDTSLRAAGRSAPRPLINRFRPMRIALLVYAFGEAALIAGNGAEYYYRNVEGFDPFLDESATGLVFLLGYAVAGLAQLVGLISSVVLVSLWTFRAMKNLHLAGADVRMSPGWAVGWYFIPFANLWKPFEGMLQIWRASRAQAGQPIKVAGYVGWWWAAWIASNMLSNLSLRLSGLFEEGPDYDAGLIVAILAGLVAIPCTFLLLRTTRTITDAQQTAGRASISEAFA